MTTTLQQVLSALGDQCLIVDGMGTLMTVADDKPAAPKLSKLFSFNSDDQFYLRDSEANSKLRLILARDSAEWANEKSDFVFLRPKANPPAEAPLRGSSILHIVRLQNKVSADLRRRRFLLVLRRIQADRRARRNSFVREFGLTAKELSVANAISQGTTLAAKAREEGQSFLTLRNQLASAVKRLNLSRQADVAVLLLEASYFGNLSD